MQLLKCAALLFVFISTSARADMAIMASPPQPPQPPHHNPHPPASAEEQRRVDFAVAQIRAKYGSAVEILHPHVIPWAFQQFEKNRTLAPAQPPLSEPHIPEITSGAPAEKMAMVAEKPMPHPQLKADEYMVHAYVRYAGDPRWHHLDVILSEDNSGNLSFRGFFDVVMPSDPGRLPPGVVC